MVQFIEVLEDGVCYFCCPRCGADIVERFGKRFDQDGLGGCFYSDYYCTNNHLILSHACGGAGKLKEV